MDIDPSFNGNSNYNKHVRRSLLPFLGDALSWLTGTDTTKDVKGIKKRVIQLIAAQSMQQEVVVHIVSILNVTRHAAQVNRQHINIVMDTVGKTFHDVNNLYNITTSLHTILVIINWYFTLDLSKQTLGIDYPISEQSPCIPWITLMQ